jgi:23S rRNA (cytosine1962-C5)-methyltransferase
LGIIRLQPDRDRPVRHRHPWIFSGAIADVEGSPAPGEIVDVHDVRGQWLARGYYNPRSQIVVRLLSWERGEEVDAAFWRTRLAAAAAMRRTLDLEPATTAYRLVFAESDLLPGLIIDRYGDWLAVQFLTLGVDARRDLLLSLVQELWAPRGIVERSDAVARKQEGLSYRNGLVAGTVLRRRTLKYSKTACASGWIS